MQAFLQLDYIQFDGFSNGLITVTADGAALVFWFALTAPLLALTLGSWFLWDRRLRKQIEDEAGRKYLLLSSLLLY